MLLQQWQAEVAGPLPWNSYHGRDQLITNPFDRLAKADGEKDRAIFRDSEIGGPIVALGAPL
jgi:hypothetical protein